MTASKKPLFTKIQNCFEKPISRFGAILFATEFVTSMSWLRLRFVCSVYCLRVAKRTEMPCVSLSLEDISALELLSIKATKMCYTRCDLKKCFLQIPFHKLIGPMFYFGFFKLWILLHLTLSLKEIYLLSNKDESYLQAANHLQVFVHSSS